MLLPTPAGPVIIYKLGIYIPLEFKKYTWKDNIYVYYIAFFIGLLDIRGIFSDYINFVNTVKYNLC